MNPDDDPDTQKRPPQYPGEDTRLTSNKEISGWYSYGWAAEVFVVCGIGIENILPLFHHRKLNVLVLYRVIHSHHSRTAGA